MNSAAVYVHIEQLYIPITSLPPVSLNYSRRLMKQVPIRSPRRPTGPLPADQTFLAPSGLARPRAPPPGARGRAARTRGHVTPSGHGGGSRRPPLRACSRRPLFLHRGPRPGALPDAGGAGAAGCHPGESASPRAGAGSGAAQAPPLPVAPPRWARSSARESDANAALSAREPAEATAGPSERRWQGL